ncbi:MAG: hypothetical protein ACYTG2_02075 [Planctomycetota bacterium]
MLAVLLLAESLVLPGRVLLPLLPDDFPAWQAGRDPADLVGHENPNWCMSDVLHLIVPGLRVNAEAAARGELPLWDPSQALGVPQLHEVHHGVLYPPAWLPVWLGYDGLAWAACLHLLIAATGMLAYLHTIGRSRTAAAVGAIAFAFSAWMTARLHSLPVVGAAVWLPWVVWGLERAARSGGHRARLIAAGALALSFFAGFPQITLWILVVAVLLEVGRALAGWRRGRPWRGALLGNAAALVVGLVIALPQILPTLDYMADDSLRTAQTAADVAGEALEPTLLWHLLVPDRFASAGLAGAHPLALLELDAAVVPAAVNRAETSMGVGVAGLLLAVLATLFGRGWRTRCAALLAAGTLTLLCWPAALQAAATVLPPLRFGNPKRLLLLSTFGLAVLAAGGLDLARGSRLRVTATGWALAVLGAALALVSRLAIPATEEAHDIEAWAGMIAERSSAAGSAATAADVLAVVPEQSFLLASDAAGRGCIVALGVAVFGILLLRPRRQHTVQGWGTLVHRWPWVLAVVLAGELLFSAWPMLRSAPAEAVSGHVDRIGSLTAPALADLVRDTGSQDGVPPRLVRLGDDPAYLRPNFPGLFGLSDLQCYAPMAPRRLNELIGALDPGVLRNGSALGGLVDPQVLTAPLIDALGVDALITDQEFEPPEGWSEHGRAGHVRVLRNEQALPRAVVVHAVETQPDPERRLPALVSPGFDPSRTVVLEDPQAARHVAGWGSFDPGDEPRPVVLSSYAAGQLRLEVGPGAPGVLVVSEGWHDGWRATVDGDEVPVWCADHTLLALPLDSRDDLVVDLRFDPPYVRLGVRLGGALWVLLLAALVSPWPRGRRTDR